MKVKFDRRSKEITFIDSGNLNANDINWQVLHAEVTPPLSVGKTLWIQFQKEVATHVSMMSKNGDLYEFEFPSEVINSAGEWSLQLFVRKYTGETLLYQDASKTTTFTVEDGLKGEGIEGPVTHATITSLYNSTSQSELNAKKSEGNALISENNAFEHAYDAQQSAKNAKQSEEDAANSASNAANSEANAVANANQAKSSAEAVLGVLEDAEEAKDAAEKSATNAKKSEDNALGSEQLAAQHAAEVKASLQEVLEEAKAYTDNEIATFDFIKIGTLPETGLINKIYLVPKTSSENNDLFDEYLWINNTWEFLGTKKVEVDLSDYLKKTTADENYVQQYKTGGATRIYGVTRQGEQAMLLVADIASAIQTQRVATYLSDAGHDINKEPNGALVTKTPVKDYQAANKKYVDEAVANAGGGGGLTEMEIDDKIANALLEAPLSNSQYMEVFEMIETNVPLHLELNMEAYLSNAGAVIQNSESWVTTQSRISALENQKLHRVTGTAFEQFYGDDGQGKECRFECVCKFPTRWGQDFLHSLYDRRFYDCGVISFRLLPPADNSFYPLHDTYNSDNDRSTLVGFNADGTFYGGATLSGNAFRVVVSVKDVVVEEIPATDNEEI